MELKTTNQINLNYLEVTFGNNQSIIDKILNSFLDNTPQLINDLLKNASQSNWEEVKLIAHKMKSSYNTLGAKVCGDILARIELESSEENKTTIHLLINQIKELSKQVFTEVKFNLNK